MDGWFDVIQHDYQEHKQAFMSALEDARDRYHNDMTAASSVDDELLHLLGSALEAKGPIRLFKYQPFSERNLRDCDAGVVHLARLKDLNDINEGYPAFYKVAVEEGFSSLGLEQFDKIDLGQAPPFMRGLLDDARIASIRDAFKLSKESGEFDSVVAPMLAAGLERLFRERRDAELCASLSTTACSASMWDRYGSQHRGFVTGYAVNSFVTDYSRTREGHCRYGFKALIAPVYYGGRPDLSFIASESIVRDPRGIGYTNMEVLLLAMSLLQKAKEWEHEQEWRVISYSCLANAEVHYCKMQPDSVFLGLDMQKDERNRVIELAQKNAWEVYEMKRSYDSPDWALDAQPL